MTKKEKTEEKLVSGLHCEPETVKEETRRLSSAKSRVDDAEMAEKTPKLRIKEFLRHTLAAVYCKSIAFMNKVIPIFVD